MTTQRYMHLSPSAVENAIRRLEQPRPAQARRHAEENQAAWRNVADESAAIKEVRSTEQDEWRGGRDSNPVHRVEVIT
jgi:hypothetical protein